MSYQQIPNEKGMYDAPPPYYTPATATAPLLLPPPATANTTVIVGKREGTSCCGIFCSVTMMVIFCLICCCCFAGITVAILFGVWAAQCSTVEYQLTVEHQANLDGIGQKLVEIENFGTLTLLPVLTGTLGIKTTTEISANSYNSALDASYENEVTPTSFALTYSSSLWSCTQQDVTAELLDSPSLSPLELNIETYLGSVTVASFFAVTFSEVSLSSRSDQVTFGFLNVTDKLSVESISGGISNTVGAIAGRKVSLEVMSGDIQASSLTTLEVDVKAMSGDVTIGDIILRGVGECEVKVEAQSGNIEITAIRITTTSPCKLELESLSGDSKVNIYGFSGTYTIKSYGGEATLNGVSCSRNSCDGVIPGGFHTLQVYSYSGDAIVALL